MVNISYWKVITFLRFVLFVSIVNSHLIRMSVNLKVLERELLEFDVWVNNISGTEKRF